MAELRVSEVFARAANRLPKEARVKLLKVFMLLTQDPRHPSLQLKKVQGAARADIYECRVDQFWRLIVQNDDGMSFQLVDVGPHDDVIARGAQVREARPGYAPTDTSARASADAVAAYLSGDDSALRFRTWTETDARDALAAPPVGE